LRSGGNESVVLSTAGIGVRQPTISWSERGFDLVLTIVLLPAVAVLAAALALAIYVDSPGPVLYRSRRIGLDGRAFDMLKFRKMRREAPEDPVTLEDDERFTPIGRFLTATRLDELPQVINVLRGEMRLVGPRPELECFVSEFPAEYAEILTVRPGITGKAQLRFSGERSLLAGPAPQSVYTDHLMPIKVGIDLDYVRQHSLLSDLLIMVRTILLPPRVLLGRLRESSSLVRVWLPSVAVAVLLAFSFVVASTHLP
jgi:lipopolysaccharide/colanic/teichoic acid biosynthesis glycosyltransferase